MRREALVELSLEGFYSTGLRTDVTQYGLMMPKVLDYVRFMQSLDTLQNSIQYHFNNIQHLQVRVSVHLYSATDPSTAAGDLQVIVYVLV